MKVIKDALVICENKTVYYRTEKSYGYACHVPSRIYYLFSFIIQQKETDKFLVEYKAKDVICHRLEFPNGKPQALIFQKLFVRFGTNSRDILRKNKCKRRYEICRHSALIRCHIYG